MRENCPGCGISNTPRAPFLMYIMSFLFFLLLLLYWERHTSCAIYNSPETVRFSKLANRKYLELLGEKGKRLAVAGGGCKKILDKVPFEWKKLLSKLVRVWEQDTQI